MALACLAARLAPAAAASVAGGRRLPLLCRAVSSKAAKAAEPATAYIFERAPNEPPLFPELLEPGRQVVLLAVDPDLGGAVAALSWQNPPAAAAPSSSVDNDGGGDGGDSCGSCSAGGASTQQQGTLCLPFDQILVEVHDMPVEIWKYGSRDKRQPEATGLIRILGQYSAAAVAAAVVDSGGGSSSSGTDSGGSGGSDGSSVSGASSTGSKARRPSKKKLAEAAAAEAAAEAAAIEAAAAAAAEAAAAVEAAALKAAAAAELGIPQAAAAAPPPQPAIVRAIVEYTMPPHACGKFAWFGIGFSVGLLNGLLAAQGVAYERVPSSTWKQQMGLKKQGKEGSIALARHLLPTAADMLKRKKDHGRAEALLMAAWGLGIRMRSIAPLTPDGSSGSSSGGSGDTAAQADAADTEEEEEQEEEADD